MCRLLAVHAHGKGIQYVRHLLSAFTIASQNDPRLAMITKGDGRHCHGVGYVLLYHGDSGWVVEYYRFDAMRKGLDSGVACKRNLEKLRYIKEKISNTINNTDEIVLIIHSRRASRNSPRGTLNAHPFHAISQYNGVLREVYLAHNGSVKPEWFARKLGIPNSRINDYVDTNLLTLWFAHGISVGRDPQELLLEAGSHVKRALMTALLILDMRGRGTLYYSGIMANNLDSVRRSYYKHYILRNKYIKIFASSTIVDVSDEEFKRDLEVSEASGVGVLDSFSLK